MTLTEYVGAGWQMVLLRYVDDDGVSVISPLPLILTKRDQESGRYHFIADTVNGLRVVEVKK